MLEGIVVAAFAIGLAMGILLRKCVCRPCGFCGGDDRKVFKASKILKPAPVQEKKAMTTTSVQSIWLLLLDDTLWNPIARCTRCKNLRYARIAWEILRRNFIQSKLSTNWSPKKDQGATTGLLCVLQNGSPIFHSFLDTMLTQNTWCWWAGGVPWCHHFVGSNPHGRYHFVGVPIPFCRGIGWAPYRMELSSSRGEFQGGWGRALLPFGTVVKSCRNGINSYTSSNELGAQYVQPHQKTIKRKKTTPEKHVPAFVVVTVCQKLKLQ